MIIITQSEIEALRCPLRHYYGYIQNLKIERYPAKNYLPIGSITHNAIDRLYKFVASGEIVFMDDNEILSDLGHFIESEFDRYLHKVTSAEIAEQVEEDIEMSKILVRIYFQTVFKQEGYEVLKSEAVFRAKMVGLSKRFNEDVYFAGKIDTIFDDVVLGRIYLHEIKTKSFFGPVARTEAMKGVQVNAYATVLRHVKDIPPLDSILYTVLKKSAKNKGESIEEWKQRIMEKLNSDKEKGYNKYIQRFPMPLPDQDYVKQMEGMVTDAIMARLRPPYRRPYLCDYCDFRMLCDKEDPNAILYYTKKEDLHEELMGLPVDFEVEL